MWLLFIIALSITISSYLLHKKFYHPVFLFGSIWTIVLFMAALNLFHIDYSETVVAVIAVMLFAFPLGSMAYSTIRRKCGVIRLRGGIRRDADYTLVPRKNIFFFLCAISAGILLSDEIEIILSILRGSSYHDIIVEAGGAQTVGISGLKGLIYIFMVYPMVYASSPICAVEVVSGSKDKGIYLISNIVLVILNAAHHGGRIGILFFIVAYVFAFLIYGKKLHITKKQKRLIISFVVVGFIAILWLTKSRGIEDIWESVYLYLVCGFPVFDGAITSSAFTSHTWGFLSLNGFIYPIMTLLRTLGFGVPETYMYTQSIRQFLEANWVYISEYGHGVNSFLPAGGYWYIDGGYIGVFLGIFITGALCQKNYIEVIKRFNKRKCALYLMTITGVLFSFIKYYLTSYLFSLSLIYICFLYKKTRKTGI